MAKKNSTKMRPLRSVFLRAAEYQHDRMDAYINGTFSPYSRFACDNINWASKQIRELALCEYCTTEVEYFRRRFYMGPYGCSQLGAWWDLRNDGAWDYESRILALLLCAEMLRR